MQRQAVGRRLLQAGFCDSRARFIQTFVRLDALFGHLAERTRKQNHKFGLPPCARLTEDSYEMGSHRKEAYTNVPGGLSGTLSFEESQRDAGFGA